MNPGETDGKVGRNTVNTDDLFLAAEKSPFSPICCTTVNALKISVLLVEMIVRG